jgi:uncharacterized membrane protein
MQSLHLVNTILYIVAAFICLFGLGYYILNEKSNPNKDIGVVTIAAIVMLLVGLALTTGFSKIVDIF